jgi:hypothetical protein
MRARVDEFTTIAERWLYYSDGRDLYPYCPPCAEREFSENAPAGARLDRQENDGS